MSVAAPRVSKDRIGRLARAALKQALGVVTGDRRLEAEGIAERSAERSAEGSAGRPGRHGGRNTAEKRDAR